MFDLQRVDRCGRAGSGHLPIRVLDEEAGGREAPELQELLHADAAALSRLCATIGCPAHLKNLELRHGQG